MNVQSLGLSEKAVLLDHLTFLYVRFSDYLQEKAKGSTVYGFKGGPAGIMRCKYVELTTDFIYPYRNQVRKRYPRFMNYFFSASYVMRSACFFLFSHPISSLCLNLNENFTNCR